MNQHITEPLGGHGDGKKYEMEAKNIFQCFAFARKEDKKIAI